MFTTHMSSSGASRIESSRQWLGLQRQAMEAWFDQSKQRDTRKQYSTQLSALRERLFEGLIPVEAALESAAETRDRGLIYDRCRQVDQCLLWIDYLWCFYRDKFDQRNTIDVMKAADEVVWSCYSQVFLNTKTTRGSAPLPFIDTFYSPKAVPRDLTSALRIARPEVRQLLQPWIASLPIPLISLPASCVHAPWWLIYIGHEVGHHIEYDLDLFALFQNNLKQALKKYKQDVINRWIGWEQEIFADAFSVCCMGQWAVRAILELTLTEESRMLVAEREGTNSYPPAVIRLMLMASFADALGATAWNALGDFDPRAVVANHSEVLLIASCLKELPNVVSALKAPLGKYGTLDRLCSWQQQAFQTEIRDWAQRLHDPTPPPPRKTLAAARRITSGAVAAWDKLPGDEPLKYREATARLRTNMLHVLALSFEEGTRSAIQVQSPKSSENLGTLLLNLSSDILTLTPVP